MKVKFKKDHLDNKAKDTKDVADDLGNYLVRTGVADEVKPKKKKKQSKPGANRKTK